MLEKISTPTTLVGTPVITANGASEQAALQTLIDIVKSTPLRKEIGIGNLTNPFLDTRYQIVLTNENEISWQMQNKIHQLLNQCYAKKTQQFICKTYAYMQPKQRILAFENGKLVGHCALATNKVLNASSNPLPVGCIGLLASVASTSIGAMLIQEAVIAQTQAGFKCSLGYASNLFVLNKILPRLNCFILDIPTIGANSKTKPDVKTLVFPSINHENFTDLCSKSEIIVSKEIF